MSINIEKFNKYYEFEVFKHGNGRIRIKKKGTEKWMYPNVAAKQIYLTYDQTPKNEEEAEELIIKGKMEKTNYKEIYQILLNYDNEKIEEITMLMDIRSIKFLDKCYENIGYIDNKTDLKIEEKYFIKKVKVSILEKANVYKIDNKYILNFGYFSPPDDYEEITYVFSKEPTDNTFKTIDLIEAIRSEAVELYCRNNNKCTFKCYECGKEIHWLDTPNHLENKNRLENLYFNIKEKYCGC